MKKIKIAIDGHGGAGKGTTAKWVAKALGYIHLDSGKVYRGVAYYFIDKGLDYNNSEILTNGLEDMQFDFRYDEKKEEYCLYLNDKNIESQLRSMLVTKHVALSAAFPVVRSFVTTFLQKFGKSGGIVMDGRDIGSTIFPDAELKVFLTADVEIRACRRQLELEQKWEKVALDDIIKNFNQRDQLDAWKASQKESFVVDTTGITIEEQIQKVVDEVKKRM